MKDRAGTTNAAFVKNHYYTGKLLHASDFINEQEYGNRKLEFINRKFHGCGIIEGLDVGIDQGGTLHVAEGSAIDPDGRIIVVPSEVSLELRELEGLQELQGQDFILGIRYDEKTVERERSYLEQKEVYQAARVEESFALKAYSLEDWKDWRESADEGAGLFMEENALFQEEKVLFQDENVRLVIQSPREVLSDSMFKCRMQARVLHGDSASIGWRCTAKLQGGFFTASGRDVRVLEERETVFSGSLMREWEICTEEGRKLPVTLELRELEVTRGDVHKNGFETCQLSIKTVSSFAEIAERHMSTKKKLPKPETDWLPLAYIMGKGIQNGEERTFAVSRENNVRLMAFCPAWEQLGREAAERSGIVDIKWRGLLKVLQRDRPPAPPFQPGLSGEWEQKQLAELLEDWQEKCIRRGIAVIPVPRRYRRGRTLVSEEISHGFPGEEVFLWCGRVYEEKNYAYWSRDKMHYMILHGAEELFAESEDSGWKIDRQALRQNVANGTFQIALTLSKTRRRNRSREVAISWIAVKTI